jgi:hypothetical protein
MAFLLLNESEAFSPRQKLDNSLSQPQTRKPLDSINRVLLLTAKIFGPFAFGWLGIDML